MERQITMIEQLLCQLFSGQCQLASLRLDISNVLRSDSIHRCLDLSSNSIQHELQSYCITLRCLYIRLNQTWFLENLIEHLPNLQQMSIEFLYSLKFNSFEKSNDEIFRRSSENWFNKVRKLILVNFSLLINKNNMEFFLDTKTTIF
jgi:hypothetical protein